MAGKTEKPRDWINPGAVEEASREGDYLLWLAEVTGQIVHLKTVLSQINHIQASAGLQKENQAEEGLAGEFREKRVGERNLVEALVEMYEGPTNFLSSTGVLSRHALSHRSSLFGFSQICVTDQRASEGCHNKATVTGL